MGHLPREISEICWNFLHRGGSLQIEVTDSHYHRSPLAQGGLEIYCSLLCFGPPKHLDILHSAISPLLNANYSPEALEKSQKAAEKRKKDAEKRKTKPKK